MHQYHKRAERLVEETIKLLQALLPRDGEDISYYNPSIMDLPLRNLIDIKILMACANEAEGRNKK